MSTRERWIGALKSAGEFPLDAPLARELERAADAALGRCKTLCVAAGLSVCMLGAMVLLTPAVGLAKATPVIAVVSAMVGFLICFAAANSVLHVRRVRRMADAVRLDGRIERFVLSPARIEGLVAAKALGLAPSDAEPATADIYCGTGTLARVDGRCVPFDHSKLLELVEVWEGERGGDAALSRAAHSRPEVAEDRRTLTEPEQLEIKRLLARQREELIKWAIVAILCAGFGSLSVLETYSSLAKGRSFSISVTLWGVAALAGLTVSGWMFAGELVGRLRVRGSLRDTCLLRLSRDDIRRESAPDSARGVMVDSAECLRPSGIVWTVDGEPAEWRTAPGRKSLRWLPRSGAALERREP